MNRHDDSHLHYRSSLFLEKDRETEKRPKEDNSRDNHDYYWERRRSKKKGIESKITLFLLTQTQEKQLKLKNSWRSQVKESPNLLIEWTQQRKWRFSFWFSSILLTSDWDTLSFFGNISFAELRTFWWQIIIACLLCRRQKWGNRKTRNQVEVDQYFLMVFRAHCLVDNRNGFGSIKNMTEVSFRHRGRFTALRTWQKCHFVIEDVEVLFS